MLVLMQALAFASLIFGYASGYVRVGYTKKIYSEKKV
jgi:hypothetical protein